MIEEKIFHLDADELSRHNLHIIEQITANKNAELVNQLLAQAYLFLNTYKHNCLHVSSGFKFRCLYCEGCRASYEECDSRYCMHANDCVLAEFIEKLEQSFIENSNNEI